MQGVMCGNEYRLTTVCIDRYERSVLCGRLYHPCIDGCEAFHSTVEFLKRMETLLDHMKFPQSFQANRVFRTPAGQPVERPETVPMPKGDLATFDLRVLFRQNASWQGSVAWREGRSEESFRSVLELLLLLDSAVSAGRVADET